MGILIGTDPISPKKTRFVLTRKNQKGQVAIFVALIFQVVFIFFALLINVGLLVHQKINLQHSTDLAAYYGAMKQAEMMNAVAHVNFQIRQAWKLLTWRYRILGTFGFIPMGTGANTGTGSQPFYPFNYNPGATIFTYNGSKGVVASSGNEYQNGSADMRCQGNPAFNIASIGQNIAPVDIPFFCVAHSGFASWPQSESNCQLDCDMYVGPNVIPRLNMVGGFVGPFGGNAASSVNAALAAVNTSLGQKCAALGPTNATILAQFLSAYANESIARSETIKMLAANLSQSADVMVDIEGKKILQGAENTFKNNLTGANFAGLSPGSFETYNGLSAQGCQFRDGLTGKEWLKRIEFKLINYFIHNCIGALGNTSNPINFQPTSVYDPSNPTGLTPAMAGLSADLRNIVASFTHPQGYHTIGYEKNPYCVEYYAVRASSEPNIPFLPLSKIRLKAVAVAKPFGGSIGPWFGREWPKGAEKSSFSDSDPNSRVDQTLPMRDFVGSGNFDLKESVYTQPNFGLYVGDRLGLRNMDYVAAYHSMLVMRDIPNYPGKAYSNANTTGRIQNSQGGQWPNYNNWEGLNNASIDMRTFDTLASAAPNMAGTRALEITAIAPNQFDVMHYSIDPDFYNNYYVKIFNNFDAIKSAAGNNVAISANQFRADFGAVGMDATVAPNPALTEKTFSVKDQILLKNIVLNTGPTGSTRVAFPPPNAAGGSTYKDALNFLINLQSSLLTGWTFLKFDDYNTFPGDSNVIVNKTDKTMTFAQCDDRWNRTADGNTDNFNQNNFGTPMMIDPTLPPAAGNCVTGGRTGYSVKLVTPVVVTDSTLLDNTLDPNFLNF